MAQNLGNRTTIYALNEVEKVRSKWLKIKKLQF